ncbi:hypothetical protein TNIN_64651 [Trichonephila inaurata madagascariensis]|uniref:Uncharacterized protein n=1 Tax=Trichonephila inaurata madagascariensis TaxID=2747483 RepID=A0A8X7BPP5_9ARAC|nr:hypothetical protein TNIN_64651 [Trichonephila inaurata madagascariensis]
MLIHFAISRACLEATDTMSRTAALLDLSPVENLRDATGRSVETPFQSQNFPKSTCQSARNDFKCIITSQFQISCYDYANFNADLDQHLSFIPNQMSESDCIETDDEHKLDDFRDSDIDLDFIPTE